MTFLTYLIPLLEPNELDLFMNHMKVVNDEWELYNVKGMSRKWRKDTLEKINLYADLFEKLVKGGVIS